MLPLLTCRPEFHPSWATHAPVTQVTLNRLGRTQVEAMIPSLTGAKTLPTAVVQQVVAKTDGVQLFVEELVKMILETGLVWEEDDRYVLTGPLPPWPFPPRYTTRSWSGWTGSQRPANWPNSVPSWGGNLPMTCSRPLRLSMRRRYSRGWRGG